MTRHAKKTKRARRPAKRRTRRDPSWKKQSRRHSRAAKKGWARRKHKKIASPLHRKPAKRRARRADPRRRGVRSRRGR